MALAGYIDVDYIVTKNTVSIMLQRLEQAISPSGIEKFLLEDAAPWIAGRAEERFASEGDSASGKWAALSPATERYRGWGREAGRWGVGDAHPINVRTHLMEQYVTGGVGAIAQTGSGGTNLTYPGTPPAGQTAEKLRRAQRGDDRTPPRPVLAMDRVDLEYLLGALARRIEGA